MENPLLQALFEDKGRRPLSVSELNAEVRAALESRFASVWVEGEITNFHAAVSGHWYFTLTDGSSSIKAACFKGQNFRIRFKPFDGIQVRVRGRMTIYEARGEYQLLVESLEPVGEGALAVAFEQIKVKLQKEGLFATELKRPLPPFPRKVGIVTSPTGAAVHDILTVLDRRARSVNIVLVPTLVQGERAGEQIAAAITMANEFNYSAAEPDRIDVLIVSRGGGSAEDLWAFNEEQVARAIRASEIPIISAVGHEVDFSIADFVADVRAATPSAAAEIVAKAESDVAEHLSRRTTEITRMMSNKMLSARADLQSLAMAPVFAEFPSRLLELRHRVGELTTRCLSAAAAERRSLERRFTDVAARLSPVRLAATFGDKRRRLELLLQRGASIAANLTEARNRRLEMTMASLNALSPLSVLDRGYSITQDAEGHILRDAASVEKGDKLNIRLARGKLGAEVLTSEHEG